MKIIVRRVRQRRRSHIDIAVRRDKSRRRRGRSARENHGCRCIRRGISTGAYFRRGVDIGIGITGIASPTPVFVTHYAGSIVESLREGHLLGHTDAEAEWTFLRSLTTPCAHLAITYRADIHQIELTALQAYIAVLHITGYLAMVGYLLRRLRLDLLNTVRLNGILRNDHLKCIGIPTCRPCDIHLTGALVEHRNIHRNGTIRRRLQLDVVQHNTSAQVIRTLKRNLIGRSYLRQR